MAAAIPVISDALLFREAISEILRRAGFAGVVGLSGAQLPSRTDDRPGGKRIVSRDIIADFRSTWPRAIIAAIGWDLQLAAQASTADLRLPLQRNRPTEDVFRGG